MYNAFRVVVPAVATSLLVALGTAGPVGADPGSRLPISTLESVGGKNIDDNPHDSAQGANAKLQRLARVARVIQDIVDDGNDQGFSSLKLNPADEQVELSWKGEIPKPVRRAVESWRNQARVVVLESKFSLAELTTEIHRLFNYSDSELGGELLMAAPLSDGSGLKLTVSDAVGAATVESALRGNRVPVRIVVGSAFEPAGRWDDTPPFWGGSAIWTGSGAICTAGFSARTATNAEVMITARHCGANSNWYSPIYQLYVGRSNSGSVALDAMTISEQFYDGAVYTGPFNSGYGVPIKGWASAIINDFACTSGSFSGNDCNTVVSDTNVYFSLNGNMTGPAFVTTQLGGVASVGQGDSGGPTIRYDTGGFKALGIISAIATGDGFTGPCQGYVPTGRQCSRVALHINIGAILSQFNLTIATS